jgi:hypothetical protein
MKNNSKAEAIKWLDRMFNIPEGYSNGMTGKIVESMEGEEGIYQQLDEAFRHHVTEAYEKENK